jgi:hypothetical protein
MTKKPSGLKPGETVPQSGLYQQIGPRGGKGPEVTSVKGEPLPSAPVKGTTYKLVAPARHQVGALVETAREAGRA